MNANTWLNPVLGILSILATIAGLAVAGILLPTVISWIRNEHFRRLLSRPFARLILWISLGTLFSFPLIDFIIWLGTLVPVISPSSAPSSTKGYISLQVFSYFLFILLILVYGSIYWLSRNYLKSKDPLNRIGRFFIISSVASLVYRGINGLFSFIPALDLPLNAQQNAGFTGFVIQFLIGLVFFIAVLAGLNTFLPGHPLSKR
jgi:hypothetical protein